jgi:hypothetical protein
MKAPLWLVPLLQLACGPCDVQDLATYARDSAGDGAVNCGVIALDDDAASAHTCLDDAFTNGRAAYARVEGADGDDMAWVVRSDGAVLKLEFKNHPEGGGDPVIDVLRCGEARTVSGARADTERDFFDCVAPLSEQRSVRVCG